ncbi:MAG: hypothetical protein A3B30_03745 [Candidatus Komeilibacteria bacterium RIFCSPLOWO2_01_FULL_52_15]|uniref:Uncharacterized protein n=2 Tax=Candidatus Komeiliibacteriota TaxID=1817908 RepID=A0A1G2BT76_9BACT|nr:MAG: hypothetical protein A2677_03705 [Candidatus Komeilibacteria bacterium RIFCSPHIGHO2_01_FULL_52_14]OGY91560.1 MAG: hypothetical protein A3B30_03745 [Candidatus Komeilibacteria bacterium RIFCSPLOWO2_01_FULL_52_15]
MDQKANSAITVFAATNFRNKQQRFGIKREDRRRHMYLIGKTGMGKSQLLENMAIQDIRNGNGVAVVDPHGDMIERILRFVPRERINDVVYFNPADLEYPIAFNVLEKVSPEQRHLVASGLIGVFKKIWADSWGPRLEYVLHNAISALLEYPSSTLLGIMRMLTDKNFRKRVIMKVNDPVVKAFWVDEYSKYPDRFQAEAIAPIQNKVGRFLTSSLMRNIVGQVASTINIREIMDREKIFLINLSKGRVGEDNSSLLGALLITKMQLAAMSRVDVPETERRDFYLYVDEFQNFATESFAGILSEARKYRLNLVLAHQYIAQLINDANSQVRDAVFGNIGTLITFRVGAADAEFMEPEFEPQLTMNDLVNLPKYHVYLKLMIDGVTSNAFSATTLPPYTIPEDSAEVVEKIIKSSRERYAKPREVIEDKIIRWAENKGDGEGSADARDAGQARDTRDHEPRRTVPAASRPSRHDAADTGPAKQLFSAICSNCGKATETKFKPDPNRPVYCQDCLQKIKRGELPLRREMPEPPRAVSLAEAIAMHQKHGPPVQNHGQIAEKKHSEHILQPKQVVSIPHSSNT